MSLANWTTRLLVGNPQGSDKQADRPSEPSNPARDVQGATEPPSFVGSRIGSYQITKRIGAGGVGEVFKGVDAMLKREVAIKVLRDDLASDPVFLARFRNEAQLQAKLSHPNVASVHAFLQEGDKQFMVMEYVAGISLDEFVRAGGPVPVQRALEIFRRALDGIDHAHGHGIVHRDIKPANIMLADSGQVKVMDFGIARAMDSQEQLTRIGHVAGTAKAMSPEQIRGKKADVRSDIYSLGIVLYTLLAGRAPFDHGNDVELMKAQLEQAPPPLRDLVDELPPKVEAAVMRALEKDPSARFQTVRDFARAIDACIAGAAPAPAAPAIDRVVEPAATASRTAINPALQGVERLPAGGAMRAERPAARAARTEGSTWIMVGVFSLGIAALGVCGALLWSQFSPADTPVAARAAPASPTEPTVPSATSTEALSKPVDTAAHAPAPAPATVPPAAPTVTTAPAMVQSPPPSPLPAPPLPTAPPATGLPADTSAATVQLPRAPVAASPTLSISRVVAGGKVVAGGSDGVQRFRPGERIRLQVTSSADAHVYCYLQDEAQRILRFYPNRFSKSARVSAKVPLEIPGKMRFELVANALMVPETVACFASERDVAAELPASVIGEDFSKLPAASLDEVRDAFARAATPRMAEGRFQIDFK